MSIASICLCFSCIMLFDKQTKATSNTSINIQDTLAADIAIQNKEYSKALALISGDESQDYYNRGTIQMLMAHDQALQSTLSWVEQAKQLVDQAKINFDIAHQLIPSKKLAQAIIQNTHIANQLETIISIKDCYLVGQNIIKSLQDILQTMQDIQATLDQEGKDIDKATIDQSCYQRLKSIVQISRTEVHMIASHLQKQQKNYLTDISNRIEDPLICKNIPYENIIPSIEKGKAWLEQYHQWHQNTRAALKSNDPTTLDALCQETKNDAQINQNIANNIQELLEKLKENQQSQSKNNTDIQYKDFFNQDQKKLLQEIKKTNEWWIQNILEVRGKGNYHPETYINNLFNEFFGNTWDFINLHQ